MDALVSFLHVVVGVGVLVVVYMWRTVSPYYFYCHWYPVLLIILRLQILLPATFRILQRHKGNLRFLGDNALWVTKNITWIFVVLWKFGEKKLIVNVLGGALLPLLLYNLSSLGPDGYGWGSSSDTPMSSTVFLFSLAAVLICDFALILETRVAMDQLDFVLTDLGNQQDVIDERSITKKLASTYLKGQNGGLIARFRAHFAKTRLKRRTSDVIDKSNEAIMSYHTLLLLYILKQLVPLVVLSVLAWIAVPYSSLWSLLIIGLLYQSFQWAQRRGYIEDIHIDKALHILSHIDISEQFFMLSDGIHWQETFSRWKEIFLEGNSIVKDGKSIVHDAIISVIGDPQAHTKKKDKERNTKKKDKERKTH